jgi:hypothetical protein
LTGLYIFLGIVGFIVLLLSIRITVNGEFFDEFKLNIKWLFVKVDILPAQKKDKPKKEKAPKEKKEKPSTEDVAPETPTEKKENIFVKFYNNQGFDGVIQLLNNVGKALGNLMHSFKKHIVLRELYLWMTVTGGCDAAETALEYGRVCQKVFPALSFICTNLTVKKYDVEIEPDFLGSKNTAQFAFSVSVRPIFILNALIVLVCRLLIKVVLKFLMGIKDKSKNN